MDTAKHAARLFPLRPALVLVACSLGVLVAQVDTSVVTLAVKRIGADLGSTVSEMQWMIDSYNLVYAALLLTGGALGDLYGQRRVFGCGIALFAIGLTMAVVMRAAATNVQAGIVPNSGHWVMEENPSATIALVIAFLTK